MSTKQNLLTGVPTSISDEIFKTIISTPNLKIERIIWKEHKSEPNFWYDQDKSEWILILKGEARLQFEDKSICLTSGDYLNGAYLNESRYPEPILDWAQTRKINGKIVSDLRKRVKVRLLAEQGVEAQAGEDCAWDCG